jgi:hypothetical protein
MSFLVLMFFFGLATAIVAKIKGSSFFIWFLIGFALPLVGLIAALLYRWERQEPRMRCPRCGADLPISDQVCMRCGEDIVWEGVAQDEPPRELDRPAEAR